MSVFLCKRIESVDELQILCVDDSLLLRLLTDGILRSVNKVKDCTSLKTVKTVCLIYYVPNGMKEVHDLIDNKIARCRLTART